jgi:putative NADH-flavin reductase
MKITIFGATGALGSECLAQALDAGHDISVLVRNPDKLPQSLRCKVNAIKGDALQKDDVERSLPPGTEAILFAIGVDKNSPQDLCTGVTRHIVDLMPRLAIDRLIWCGGGSTFVEQDQIGFGAKFVRWFSATFLSLRHFDKEHQYELLRQHQDINWIGIRPLQMNAGEKTGQYRLGFDRFSGMSKITFADCAHAMVGMLEQDTWLGKAPVVQY